MSTFHPLAFEEINAASLEDYNKKVLIIKNKFKNPTTNKDIVVETIPPVNTVPFLFDFDVRFCICVYEED